MKHPLASFQSFQDQPCPIFLMESKAILIKISETLFPISTLTSSKKTLIETEQVLMHILATDLSSELQDHLKIHLMLWQLLQLPMPNKLKQLLKEYSKEKSLISSSNNLFKKQKQSDLKEMAIARNGRLKQSEEVCMLTKISLKFIL